MLRNHLKIAFRSFWKNKLTTAINVIGLSIGIACASLAFIFIQYERSFDKFHQDSEQIHVLHTLVNDAFKVSTTPGALGPDLVTNFPEVGAYMRLIEQELIIDKGQEIFKEEALFVDANFFDFFSFTLIEGNPHAAFDDINSVILTEAMAQQYFGTKQALGKTLTIHQQDNPTLLTVAGVVQAAPNNSSVQFDFLIPLAFLDKGKEEKLDTNWGSCSITSLLRLNGNTRIEQLEAKLPAFVEEKMGKEKRSFSYAFHLNPLESYHFDAPINANGLVFKGNKNYVHILLLIALLILAVACLNFTNLSNARGSRRLTEVGVRKVLGAARSQLQTQFLTESILLSLTSVTLAIGLIEGLLSFATQVFEYPLDINWLSPTAFLPLLGVALATGLLAGAYPAFLLSNLKIVNTFQSTYKIGGNNMVTKVGLVFQFTLSIGLLACSLIMWQQQSHIKESDLGFEQDAIVVIPTQIQSKDKIDTDQMLTQYRSAVAASKGILQMTGVSHAFTQGNTARPMDEDTSFENWVFDYRVEPSYLEVLDIELLEGRNFSLENPQDFGKSIIVNETFKNRYVKGDLEAYRLPKENFDDLAEARIIGVVKDYNFADLKSQINPMMLHIKPNSRFRHFLVKIRPEKVGQTLTELKQAWQELNPNKPFEYSFLDEDIQQQYTTEERWNKVISGTTLLAILVGFLGLFGLVALSLVDRTKEIGIRKVLGANLGNIIALLSKDFLILLALAFVLAAPVAWYFMQQWLENFVYRIDIQWWIFLVAGLMNAFIALLTISLQSVKTALANPVESLRSE